MAESPILHGSFENDIKILDPLSPPLSCQLEAIEKVVISAANEILSTPSVILNSLFVWLHQLTDCLDSQILDKLPSFPLQYVIMVLK